MMRFLILVPCLLSFELSSIPHSKSPPKSMIESSAVYDKINHKIITIGGREASSEFAHSQLYSFDLKTNEFLTIRPTSEFKPSYYEGHFSYLRQDRKIFVFGKTSDIFSFNLNTSSWIFERLSGDLVGNIMSAGYASFDFKGISYVGIFGGINDKGFNNDLLLIDMMTLESKRMKNLGDVPKNRIYCTLVYYQEALYYFGSSIDYDELDNNLYKYDLNTEHWEIVETVGKKPDPRNLHTAYVYDDEMFILFGAIILTQRGSDEIHRFNFEKKKWSQVFSSPSLIRVFSASVMIDSKIYFLYGRNEAGIFNSVISVDLSQNPIQVEELSSNFLTPTERFSHCAHVINTFMYVFAGSSGHLYDTEKIYSDLWRFDLIQQFWEYVTPVGDVPSKRKLFASTKIGGNRFAIFGGENEGGLLNDMYFFHEPYLKWYKINPIGTLIQGRISACMVSLKNWLFIIGGKSFDNGFNDIWVYNFENNELKVLVKNVTKTNLNSVQCWVEEIEKNIAEIVITGGTDFISTPSSYTVTIRFFIDTLSFNLTLDEVKNKGCVLKAKSSAIKQGDKILSIGGHIYDSNMLRPFILFSLLNNSCNFLPGPQDLNIYDHSTIHFNKSLYIFGGGGKVEHVKSQNIISNILFKVEVTDVEGFTLKYSEGFDKNGKICGKGTFSLNGTCEKCPKGKFGNTFGSSNINQCLPCPYGTFSNIEGAVQCLDCPTSFNCPIGSILPQKYIIIEKNKSIQPNEYSSEKETIRKVSAVLWLCFCGIIVCLIISLYLSREIWSYLNEIDIFTKDHYKITGVPIIYKRTPLGGIFSFVFFLIALILIICAILSFHLDNLQEYKTLVPVITLNEEIVSDYFSLNLQFYIYGGECVRNNSCHPDISYQDFGLNYNNRTMRCEVTAGTCSIILIYEKFSIFSEKSSILVNSKEYGSYSSYISVNITSDSSIPHEISSQFTIFTTSSQDSVFRGYDASTISYQIIPSVLDIQIFRSDSNKWKEKDTGFHISVFSEPQLGSIATYEKVNILNGLAVKIFIIQNENAMVTRRITKQDWIGFVGGLLGSVFGLMSALIVIMNLVERVERAATKRLKFYRLEKKQCRELQKVKCEFEDLRRKVRNRKRFSAGNSIVPTWM